MFTGNEMARLATHNVFVLFSMSDAEQRSNVHQEQLKTGLSSTRVPGLQNQAETCNGR